MAFPELGLSFGCLSCVLYAEDFSEINRIKKKVIAKTWQEGLIHDDYFNYQIEINFNGHNNNRQYPLKKQY